VIKIGADLALASLDRLGQSENAEAQHQDGQDELSEDLGAELLHGMAPFKIVPAQILPRSVPCSALGIVLIRTFLSMSLEIELKVRLPWRGSASCRRGN
jgi:hypothetical protein